MSEDEWISVKDKLPTSGQRIIIRVSNCDGKEIETESKFTLYDIDENTEAWGWTIDKELNVIARPTHWKPLFEINMEKE